jgi:hypothetical protein
MTAAALQTDDNRGRGLEVLEGAPDPAEFGTFRHRRVSEVEELPNQRLRFTLTCDDGQEDEVKAAIKKLNRKLKKFGQEITVVREEVVFKDHWLTNGRIGPEVRDSDGVNVASPYGGRLTKRAQVRTCLLTIETPAVAGVKAKLIGSFELAEDGESVYRHAFHGATEADLEPFLARWRDCDHCGFKRGRRATFLCETEEGDRVLIGRQCSRDYLGLDAADLLARDAVFRELVGANDDEEGLWGGAYRNYFYVPTAVDLAYKVARKLGGYSREISDKFRRDYHALNGVRDYGRDTTNEDIRRAYKEWEAKHPIEPLDAQAFADYIWGVSGDFGENLRIVFSCEYAKNKRLGLVLAGVGLFVGRAAKLKAEAEKNKALPPAKLIEGKEGDRVDFEAEVVRTFVKEGVYGTTCIVSLRGDDGAAAVNFHTGIDRPKGGERYHVRGTIKRQGTNRITGKPETVLARCIYTAPTGQEQLL